MEQKLNKFEGILASRINIHYNQLDAAKKEYESHLKSFGFNDCITRDIAKIQILQAKIEALENMMDEFGYIFERGEE